jgi:thiamine biosynthesis lipoprotein
MGTRVEVIVQSPGRAAEVAPAVDAAFAQMQRLEALFSRYRSGNPVHALALAAGVRPLPVPAELLAVLRDAREVSRRTGGAFDITVGAYSGWRFDSAQPARVPPADELARQRALVDYRDVSIDERDGTALLARRGMRIDLGGIAKLSVLEAGMQVLARHGLHDALIDGGGDMRASGRVQGRAWRVGVRDPLRPERLLGSIELSDGWVASSGDYERAFLYRGRRYHHILDPASGMPARGPRGVTLIARELRPINGLGTALMVGGKAAAARWLPALPGVEALLVNADGSRWTTAGLPARLLPA